MARHLTPEERDRIAQLRNQQVDQKDIAQAIGRARSTISRELRRNATQGEYRAAQAQRQAELRRRERPLVRKMDDPEINRLVRSQLTQESSLSVELLPMINVVVPTSSRPRAEASEPSVDLENWRRMGRLLDEFSALYRSLSPKDRLRDEPPNRGRDRKKKK